MQVKELTGERADQPARTIDSDPLIERLSAAHLPNDLVDQVSQRLERLEQQISAQIQLIDQLRAESLTDILTGLPNRRAYDEKLQTEWTRARRNHQPIALISIDVDHFKQYNDSYGHDDGDLCLKQVADTLKQTVQRSADLACRVGGEEFMVVVPGATTADAVALAEKIRRHMEAKGLKHEKNLEGHGVVTVSVGVADTIPTSEQTPDDLYKAADQALYQAKQSGRNRVRIADDLSAKQMSSTDVAELRKLSDSTNIPKPTRKISLKQFILPPRSPLYFTILSVQEELVTSMNASFEHRAT